MALGGERAGVLLQYALSITSGMYSHLIALPQMALFHPDLNNMPSRSQSAHPARPTLRPSRLRTASPTTTMGTSSWRTDGYRREVYIFHLRGRLSLIARLHGDAIQLRCVSCAKRRVRAGIDAPRHFRACVAFTTRNRKQFRTLSRVRDATATAGAISPS
jgi:hypothetical protein